MPSIPVQISESNAQLWSKRVFYILFAGGLAALWLDTCVPYTENSWLSLCTHFIVQQATNISPCAQHLRIHISVANGWVKMRNPNKVRMLHSALLTVNLLHLSPACSYVETCFWHKPRQISMEIACCISCTSTMRHSVYAVRQKMPVWREKTSTCRQNSGWTFISVAYPETSWLSLCPGYEEKTHCWSWQGWCSSMKLTGVMLKYVSPLAWHTWVLRAKASRSQSAGCGQPGARPCCPEGIFALGSCGMHHQLAVSLSWLGILKHLFLCCLTVSGVGIVGHFLILWYLMKSACQEKQARLQYPADFFVECALSGHSIWRCKRFCLLFRWSNGITKSHTKVLLPCGLIRHLSHRFPFLKTCPKHFHFFLKSLSHWRLRKCPTMPTPKVLKQL